MKLLGILLIVVGLAALVYRTVNESAKSTLKSDTQWYVYAGGFATAVGVYLLMGKRKKNL